MNIKDFFEEQIKLHPMKSIRLGEKLIELEGIENWLRMMYGIDLDISLKPVEQKGGRFYGKGVAEYINKLN